MAQKTRTAASASAETHKRSSTVGLKLVRGDQAETRCEPQRRFRFSGGKLEEVTLESYASKIRELGISKVYYLWGLQRDLNVTARDARKLASIYDIRIVRKWTYTRIKVKEAIASGMTDLQVRQKFGVKLRYAAVCAKQMGLKPDSVRDKQDVMSRLKAKRLRKVLHPRHQQRNRLILRGLSLREIAKHEDMTREGINRYIIDHGMHGYWQQSRRHYKQNKESEKLRRAEINAKLLSILDPRNKIAKERFNPTSAEARAIEYLMINEQPKYRYLFAAEPHNNSIPSHGLITLFSAYDAARQEGVKKSIRELSEISGISKRGVLRIFKRLNISSMRAEGNMWKRPTQTERARLRSAISYSPIQTNGIAYFSERNKAMLERIASKKRKVPNTIRMFRQRGNRAGFYHLTYQLASQIYGAQDMGFRPNEMAELFDKPLVLINYAISNRATISRPIIGLLRRLYPEMQGNRPYLPKDGPAPVHMLR